MYIGSVSGLLPDGTKPLPEPMLISVNWTLQLLPVPSYHGTCLDWGTARRGQFFPNPYFPDPRNIPGCHYLLVSSLMCDGEGRAQPCVLVDGTALVTLTHAMDWGKPCMSKSGNYCNVNNKTYQCLVQDYGYSIANPLQSCTKLSISSIHCNDCKW